MANAVVTGTVIVRYNNLSISSKPGAKLDLGGYTRTPVFADGVLIGSSSKPEASKVSCTLAHTSSSDLDTLNNAFDGTLLFETDSGVTFTIRNAFLVKPPELTGDGGDVAVEFAGQPAVKTVG